MRRFRSFLLATSVVTGTIAACNEHLPARLDRAGVDVPTADAKAEAAPPLEDASLDAESIADADASIPDADASIPDAPLPIEGGACNARVEAPALAFGAHVADGTVISYASNPPSSGPHYGTWANFQEFTRPIDDGYLVHAMEHGAVLLLYKCDDPDAGACNDLRAQLRAVRDAVPTDPMCSDAIRVRVILAPRPTNDVPVAAAAWGHTYRADCVDATTLGQFITANYAKAPEDFCFPGSVF